TAHEFVDGKHVERDMVESGRSGQDGQPMMRGIAAQEDHERADPVGQAEAKHGSIELLELTDIRTVQHDVAEPDRDRLAPGQGSVLALSGIAPDLNCPPVRVEEAEAIAAAEIVDGARLGDEPGSTLPDLSEQRLHILSRSRDEADQIGLLL